MSESRGPTTEELRARVLAHHAEIPGSSRAPALVLARPCLACNREQGERMCDLCQRLEIAEAAAPPLDSEGAERQ